MNNFCFRVHSNLCTFEIQRNTAEFFHLRSDRGSQIPVIPVLVTMLMPGTDSSNCKNEPQEYHFSAVRAMDDVHCCCRRMEVKSAAIVVSQRTADYQISTGCHTKEGSGHWTSRVIKVNGSNGQYFRYYRPGII